MPKATSFKDMFVSRLLAATPEETIREVALDTSVAKALYGPDVSASGQERPEAESGDRVVDQSVAPMSGRVPGREEIKLGPAQEASGGGAERMIRQYSDPNPQQDIVVQYERLSGMLGDIGKSMKAMSDAFTAILKKAEDEKEDVHVQVEQEEEEDEKGHGKSLTSELLADILAKAEEEEEEEEEDDHEAEKALPATSKMNLAKALFEAVQAARKSKVPAGTRSRVTKASTAALQRAYRMAKAASAEAEDSASKKAAAKTAGDIAEFAFVRGIKLASAPKATSAEVAAKAEEAEDHKDGKDHNQDKWPAGAKAAPGLEEVLKGQAILNGNIMSMLDAMSGKGGSMPVTDLGLVSAKAVGVEGQDTKTLFKSNPAAWETVKREQIQAAVDSGEFQLSDELAAGTILATAQAVQHGAVDAGLLKARISTGSEAIRSLFADVLAAA